MNAVTESTSPAQQQPGPATGGPSHPGTHTAPAAALQNPPCSAPSARSGTDRGGLGAACVHVHASLRRARAALLAPLEGARDVFHFVQHPLQHLRAWVRARNARALTPFTSGGTADASKATARRPAGPGRGAPAVASARGALPLLAALALLLVHPAGLASTGAEALPVNSLLWSLRAMVGSWVVLMAVVCVLVWRGPSIQATRWRFALWACVLTLPLPWIAMISGWLALELGQRPQVSASLGNVQTAGGGESSMVLLLGWGSAYALLMIMNIKLSLRWLRMEPQSADRVTDSSLHEEPYLPGAQPSSPLVEGLAKRYRVGEFQQYRGALERPEPLMLADVVHGKTFDVDKLRRAIVRLRKERNALRKVLKTSKRGDGGGSPLVARHAVRALPAPPDEIGGDTQMIPVLKDVIRPRRSSS
jgi:hypothetical protein